MKKLMKKLEPKLELYKEEIDDIKSVLAGILFFVSVPLLFFIMSFLPESVKMYLIVTFMNIVVAVVCLIGAGSVAVLIIGFFYFLGLMVRGKTW